MSLICFMDRMIQNVKIVVKNLGIWEVYLNSKKYWDLSNEREKKSKIEAKIDQKVTEENTKNIFREKGYEASKSFLKMFRVC